ncbi:thiamine diphosphokinase [Myroides sp. LJL115]
MSKYCDLTPKESTALIIANGASCSQELLKQELSKAHLVVVLDSAMQRVAQMGIKADVLLGDFDRDFQSEHYLKQYPNLEIVKALDQNFTDLEKAFDYLKDKGFEKIRVIWATGKRADHTINNIANIARYKKHLQITLLDDYSTIFVLEKHFEKYYQKNTILSLIPITQVSGIYSRNLQYPLNNNTLILGYQNGTSNAVLKDGMVKITHENGDLILMESYE